MSLNAYDKISGELVTLANGQRIWVGTTAAHEAAVAAGTMPNNCLVAITDDGDVSGVVDAVENGNMNPVTSNAVYDQLVKTGSFDRSYMPYIASYDLFQATGGTLSTRGFLKITFPFGKLNIMTKLTVDIFQYSTSTAQYQISFYPYNTGSPSSTYWTLVSPVASSYGNSYQQGSTSYESNYIDHLPVSFGFDNSDADHVCIWIGKTDGSTTFQYPHILLRDGMCGFPYYNANYLTGTTMEFVSTIDGINRKTVTT